MLTQSKVGQMCEYANVSEDEHRCHERRAEHVRHHLGLRFDMMSTMSRRGRQHVPVSSYLAYCARGIRLASDESYELGVYVDQHYTGKSSDELPTVRLSRLETHLQVATRLKEAPPPG